MKVCIVTSQYRNIWSGGGTYATCLINGLAERPDMQISMICPGAEQAMVHPAVRLLECPSLPFKATLSFWPVLAFVFSKALHQALRHESFDIVHFADARESLMFRCDAVRIVGSMHDYYFMEAPSSPLAFKRYYSDWLLRWGFYHVSRILECRAMRALDLVIANTRYVAESLARNYHIAPEKIATVYYGMAPVNATAAPQDPQHLLAQFAAGSPKLIFVGGNFQRKGLPTLIRAVHLLKSTYPDIKLFVVGKDRKQGSVERLANSLGLADNVNFLGGVENTLVRALEACADMLVVPSLIEAFGLVYLEAMWQNVPAIGGDCGGTPELIEHGSNGLLAKPGNHQHLAGQISRLVEEPALRVRIIDNGNSTTAQFSIEKMIQHTVKEYSARI